EFAYTKATACSAAEYASRHPNCWSRHTSSKSSPVPSRKLMTPHQAPEHEAASSSTLHTRSPVPRIAETYGRESSSVRHSLRSRAHLWPRYLRAGRTLAEDRILPDNR